MSESADACPVDHKARAAWLEQSRKSSASQTAPSNAMLAGESCDSSTVDQSPPSMLRSALPKLPGSRRRLSNDREISTIPRAQSTPAIPSQQMTDDGSSGAPGAVVAASASHGAPANNERETGADRTSGNWIYPSEQMFFDAMRRKKYEARAEDMRSIIPIHNAVNERAWSEIKEWERGRGSELCGGPKLLSFSGQSSAMTPKARFYSLLGYAAPFDRHDWVVDRCGKKVEYVIDFYAGKHGGGAGLGKPLSFYLDVRPKLNSLEGWKMRAEKILGV